MYELQYLTANAIGLVSLLMAVGLYRYHNEVELFAAISMFTWLVLAIANDTVVTLDQTGATHTFDSGAMQLISGGLALVSLLALVGSLMNKWPTTEDPV
jgi:hypothetical protein